MFLFQILRLKDLHLNFLHPHIPAKSNQRLDVIGYLVNKHYARVGSSTVSKTTDQYGQFSLSVSNGYIVACGVDYRYWVMRHGETSFRLMKQGSYAIQASTTVTVWYIYVIYSS